MTKIDFYVLPEASEMARLHFACRLTEKAAAKSHQVFIAVEDQHAADTLSDALWHFKPESFVGHDVQGQSADEAQVLIGWQEEPQHHDLLINLRAEIPTHFSRFQRLAEVVTQEQDVLTITRTHFQFYRDRGYPLESHNISR